MVQNSKKILLHACCGICSAYPISLLKEMGYEVIVYFSNSNLDTQDEFNKRLNAQNKVCNYHNVKLIVSEYNHNEYLDYIKGLENEPERGERCKKCILYRLKKTVQKAKELGIDFYTTSLPISPHKKFDMIVELANSINNDIKFIAIDFKKKDGFVKTNKLAKELEIYRQNYCGCEFAKSHLLKEGE